MARVARKKSASGFYHVMLKRICRQILFEDDSDRRAFLQIVQASCNLHGLTIHAWCLMDNHVHLLVADPRDALSQAIHRTCCLYAHHVNKKTGSVGHVFQNRFRSIPVETESYLLEVVRYIHNNPERACMCPAAEYPWSSYFEYAYGRRGMTSTSLVLEMLGGPDGFVRFMAERPTSESPSLMVVDQRSPEELLAFARDVIGRDPSTVAGLPKALRNETIVRLSSSGLSIRQIERITGVGRNTVARAIAAAARNNGEVR